MSQGRIARIIRTLALTDERNCKIDQRGTTIKRRITDFRYRFGDNNRNDRGVISKCTFTDFLNRLSRNVCRNIQGLRGSLIARDYNNIRITGVLQIRRLCVTDPISIQHRIFGKRTIKGGLQILINIPSAKCIAVSGCIGQDYVATDFYRQRIGCIQAVTNEVNGIRNSLIVIADLGRTIGKYLNALAVRANIIVILNNNWSYIIKSRSIEGHSLIQRILIIRYVFKIIIHLVRNGLTGNPFGNQRQIFFPFPLVNCRIFYIFNIPTIKHKSRLDRGCEGDRLIIFYRLARRLTDSTISIIREDEILRLPNRSVCSVSSFRRIYHKFRNRVADSSATPTYKDVSLSHRSI